MKIIYGLLPLLCLLLLSAGGWGCPVPVYQYSLEFWPADPYEVFVFHAGDWSEADQRSVERLDKEVNQTGNVNILLHLMDLQDVVGQRQYGIVSGRDELPEQLPWVIVHYPIFQRTLKPVWSGPLTEAAVQSLLFSPIRQEMAEKLAHGETAVWLFLESGDRAADNQAYQVLKTELERLEPVLQFVDKDLWLIDQEPPPISFHIIRLNQTAADESFLVQMMLSSEPDLSDLAHLPMVFPVYGRGLLMYALVGRGINQWTIREAADFLVGPCSCQVKALNPGTDLLISMDWDEEIRFRTGPAFAPGSTDLTSFFQRAEEAEERLGEDN